jgi:hypothetical protein
MPTPSPRTLSRTLELVMMTRARARAVAAGRRW